METRFVRHVPGDRPTSAYLTSSYSPCKVVIVLIPQIRTLRRKGAEGFSRTSGPSGPHAGAGIHVRPHVLFAASGAVQAGEMSDE